MTDYKISIVILLDNVKNIGITLNSLNNQTFRNFEILCLNNLSYKVSFEDVKVLNNETIDSILTESSGEYILFIRPGDYFFTNSLKFLDGVLSDERDMVLFKSNDYCQENRINKNYYDLKLKNDYLNLNENDLTGSDIFNNELTNLNYINNKLFSKKFLSSNYEKVFDNNNHFNFVFDIKASVLAKNIIKLDETIVLHKTDNIHENFKEINEKRAIPELSSFEIVDSIEEIESFLLQNNLFNIYKYDFIKFKLKILTDNLDISKFHNYIIHVPENERTNLKSNYFDYSKYYNSNSNYVGFSESYSNNLFNKTKKYLSKEVIGQEDFDILMEDPSFKNIFEKYNGILHCDDFKDYITFSNKSKLDKLKEENIKLKTEKEFLTNNIEVYENIIDEEQELINESKRLISSTKVDLEYLDYANSKLVKVNNNSSSIIERIKDKLN